MQKLKAFIAHSFDEKNDGVLINKFLDYFNSLKDTADLEWDHAERAEMKAISQKVKEKMEDKDLFIGIFTSKNYKIDQGDLKKSMPLFNYGRKHLFSKGSSDWIIQESGYALAKDMHLLFLVEEDTNVDAGLQGDLEFVTFNRNNPSACFVKINEIIGSLSIKSEEALAIPMSASPPVSKDDSNEHKNITEDGTQRERDKFVEDFMFLRKLIIEDKNIIQAEKKRDDIIKEYEGTRYSPSYWKAIYYEFKYDAGFPEASVELKLLCEDNPSDHRLNISLARIYRSYKQYAKAAEQYLKISSKQSSEKEKINYVTIAAECLALDGHFKEAYKMLLEQFRYAGMDTEIHYQLFKGLHNIAKLQENEILFISFAEKVLDIYPTDYDIRFSLAYKYSEIGNNDISLSHYKFLCENDPDGTKLNNIGVVYQRLDIKGKSVESYEKASEKYSETLAMANIAYKYIDGGFLDKAYDILKLAQSKDKYHENVDAAMAKIREVKRNEEESSSKILRNIEPMTKFLIKFADTYVLTHEKDIIGEWTSKHGKIKLNIDRNKIYGETEIQRTPIASPSPAVASLLTGLIGEESKIIITINGAKNNGAINYELKIKTIYTSMYGNPREEEKAYNGLMCVAEDAKSIEVMEWEKEKKDKVTFYEMTKSD